MSLLLVTSRQDLTIYVDQVRLAADQEREAFGFLPSAAYDDFAYQERMVVACDKDTNEMVGYTVIGGALPQGRIFQTWAKAEFRTRGVGRALVEEAVRRFESWGYLSIRADVACDLGQANEFYARMGFEVVRVRSGQGPRKRPINVRVRELATPSLLDIEEFEADGLGRLDVNPAIAARSPLYVLDVNVLFDVAKGRVHASSAQRVIHSAFENDVRLAVSSEFVRELEQHTAKHGSDPILELAKALPRLRTPTGARLEHWLKVLGPLVFPGRTASSSLRSRDVSDLGHLATAIEECAAGFITSEKAILQAGPHLRSRHMIDVLSPASFGPGDEGVKSTLSLAGSIKLVDRDIQDSDREGAERFLAGQHVPSREIKAILAFGSASRPRRRRILLLDSVVVAVASWDHPATSQGARTLYATLDESSPHSSAVADHILTRAVADVGRGVVTVTDFAPLIGQTTLRRTAIGIGFFSHGGRSPRARTLRKIAVGGVVSSDDWLSMAKEVFDRTGLNLPTMAPDYDGPEQPLEIGDSKGKTVTLSLATTERLLSPVLLALPRRPAVVLPITASYAEELFRGSSQPNMLSDREAILHSTRGYIGSALSYGTIKDGSLVVFYESGRGRGRSAAIAVARVVHRYLLAKAVAPSYAERRAVLDAETIRGIGRGDQVTVTEFSDLMIFDEPVPLSTMRQIGCVDGTNFVTARAITPEHVKAILDLGRPRA